MDSGDLEWRYMFHNNTSDIIGHYSSVWYPLRTKKLNFRIGRGRTDDFIKKK